ncbi:ribosome biogenesis GTPase Der [soil metagenome]
MSFTLAIVGRPNVGKSTLFNRLVGKRLALVDDTPGVTRDLREGVGRLGAMRFRVIDTAGLEEADAASLTGRMRALTERAVAMADIVLFLIDARAGVMPADAAVAELLRRRGVRVILAANKAEGRAGEAGALEAYSLGLGEPIPLSGEHGEGIEDLFHVLREAAAAFAPVVEVDVPEDEPANAIEDEDASLRPGRPIQIAVVGRPNAGKSTLVNAIIGEERLLTGPEAGITRDAIAIEADWGGVPVRIFDTAGMRRKAKVQEKLEKLSVADGLRAVKFAEVVILIIDVGAALESQDLRIADLAEREGRALVVAVNKWDLEAEKRATLAALRDGLERLLPQVKGAPMVPVSALTGQGLDRLRAAVVRAHAVWNARVPTARLNAWLAEQVAAHPPPAPSGRRVRLRYMTQVKARPPTFVVFASVPEAVPEDYRRFLVNGLRRDFDMPGTPIRLHLRGGDNPYKGRKKPKATTLDKHRPRRVPNVGI